MWEWYGNLQGLSLAGFWVVVIAVVVAAVQRIMGQQS